MKLNIIKKLLLPLIIVVGLGAQSLYPVYRLVVKRKTRTSMKIELFNDGQEIGSCTCDFRSTGQIPDLFIKGNQRGHGLGGRFFRFVRDFMIKIGCKKVCWIACPTDLSSSTSDVDRKKALDKLVGFYQRQGGSVVSIGSNIAKMQCIPADENNDAVFAEYVLACFHQEQNFDVTVRPSKDELVVGSLSDQHTSQQIRETAQKLLGNFAYRYFGGTKALPKPPTEKEQKIAAARIAFKPLSCIDRAQTPLPDGMQSPNPMALTPQPLAGALSPIPIALTPQPLGGALSPVPMQGGQRALSPTQQENPPVPMDVPAKAKAMPAPKPVPVRSGQG